MIYLLVLIVLLSVFWIFTYNSLIKYRNWVRESWAQIDVQLKRRYDLIPNLVETVKGYAKHEQETLEKVIRARNDLVGTGKSPQERVDADIALTSTLRSLFALAEAYPDLKANQNFMMLQEELSGTENKIAYARQLYNNTIMKYNTKIQSFPTNLIASFHGFTEESMLEIPERERENIQVRF
ncbi:LemA family protein [Heliorestis acidaminivorans]|uniref:LemA family protein n=1 Tax=Heliorestis acidaminivorans TaxID=553427 RepID=A0A6I0EW67_9FIRM|nr:LemA family protein [Heliorestis acidaminivorans]